MVKLRKSPVKKKEIEMENGNKIAQQKKGDPFKGYKVLYLTTESFRKR